MLSIKGPHPIAWTALLQNIVGHRFTHVAKARTHQLRVGRQVGGQDAVDDLQDDAHEVRIHLRLWRRRVLTCT